MYAGVDTVVLRVAASDRELAIGLWEMFRELDPDSVEDAADAMCEILHKDTEPHTKETTPRSPAVDRASMAIFYMEHVDQYRSR